MMQDLVHFKRTEQGISTLRMTYNLHFSYQKALTSSLLSTHNILRVEIHQKLDKEILKV